MRRTDLSRKLGKVAVYLEEEIAKGRDINKLITKLGDEIGLKPSKAIKTKYNTLVPYKDNEFEGTIKRADILAYDSELEVFGIRDRDIVATGATAQIIYTFNSPDGENGIEIRLVADAEYKDKAGKKHKAYPVLKTWKVEIDDEEEIATEVIEDDEDIEDDEIEESEKDSKELKDSKGTNTKEDDEIVSEDDSVDEDDNTEEYKINIGKVIKELFSVKYFGSVVSDELSNTIIGKIHKIYLPTYLGDVYNNIDDIDMDDTTDERIYIVKRILDTL